LIFKLALLSFPHQILVGGFWVWSRGHDVGPALEQGLYDELVKLQKDHPLAPLSAAVVARTVEVL